MATFDIQPSTTPRALKVYAPGTYTSTSTTLVHIDHINCEGMTIIVNISATPTGTTPTMVVQVQGWDPYAMVAYNLGSGITTGTLNASGTTILRIHPFGTNSTTVAQDIVPPHTLFTMTIGGTTPSFSASVTAMMDL